MNNKLWVIEENYNKIGWYPLVDYISTKRERAIKELSVLRRSNTDNLVKYRVSKYERKEKKE
jgi:hypothetical protein